MPEIPGSIWRRPDMLAALQARDIAQTFRLIRQYAGMSQTAIGSLTGMSQGKISEIMSGNQRVIALAVFERIADGLGLPDTARAALGLAPRAADGIPSQDGSRATASGTVVPARSVEASRPREDDSVQRRTFVGLTAATIFGGVRPDNALEELAAALTECSPPVAGVPTLTSMTAAVTQAKQDYQACRYGDVLTMLPALLRSLRAACTSLDGDDQRRAQALSAETYHVAASVMLKQEDKGLAWLAADRSVRAAELSEAPLMIGSSARIITHALMDGGHHRAAAGNASTAARRMDTSLGQPSDNDLSVYGALLLRGAIAAAQRGDRYTVAELLDEAEQAGRRLGHDGNHMWTAFGPNNVLCHRVNAALTMGDAGSAIEYARQVSIDALPINERRATLLLDTARAFVMWGKHERAFQVLRAAEQIAPEEITGRPATRRLVGDLATTAPISVRHEAREFADALGITA
ncbi:helix-turn-helix transcriptional regulator [Actinoplanes sp. NPDC024001]|uniref:helix-turn-helix domain-containing protein n=1 Tax=Actinoplanes sp. NPDC024001 TaxID=3154598 RepID=UPI0033F27405